MKAAMRAEFFVMLAKRKQPGAQMIGAASQHDLTDLLKAWAGGDQDALQRLVVRVYKELHRLAARYMAEQPANHPLQATALIHEAYLRLAGWKDLNWENRARFFAAAAQLMRHILVDIARSQRQAKRGGGMKMTTLDEACIVPANKPRDLLVLDEALTRLQRKDPRKCRVVELKFFGGLSVEETASILGVSTRTVLREWNAAKAWLCHEVKSG